MKLRIEDVGFFWTLNMDEGSIVRRASPIEGLVGVYFLVLDNRVVYVGMSFDIPARIRTHINERAKAFDRVFVLECHPDFVCDLETLYITRLRPKYNAQNISSAEGSRAFKRLNDEFKRRQTYEDQVRAEFRFNHRQAKAQAPD
jgi:hypothetical protein